MLHDFMRAILGFNYCAARSRACRRQGKRNTRCVRYIRCLPHVSVRFRARFLRVRDRPLEFGEMRCGETVGGENQSDTCTESVLGGLVWCLAAALYDLPPKVESDADALGSRPTLLMTRPDASKTLRNARKSHGAASVRAICRSGFVPAAAFCRDAMPIQTSLPCRAKRA